MSLGCNAGGVHPFCRFCGFGAYADIACPAPPPPPPACNTYASATCAGPSEPCYYDPTCAQDTVSLGCNAGGVHPHCRFCGFGAYSEIVCPALTPPPPPMVPTVVFSVTVSGTAEDLDLYSFRTSLLAFLHEDDQLANVELNELIVEVRAGSIVLDTTIVLDEAEVQTTQDNVGAMLLSGQASSTLAVDVIAYTMPAASTTEQSSVTAAQNSLVDLEAQALSTSENNNAATVALVRTAAKAAATAAAATASSTDGTTAITARVYGVGSKIDQAA